MMDEEVAIVGLWCRFPSAEGPDEFWRVLENGEDCMREIPPERWNQEAWYNPDRNTPGKSFVERAGFVDDFKDFDNRLFNISDLEASRMDPQQRWMLECSYKALENAGIPLKNVYNTDTGVFVGVMNYDYYWNSTLDMADVSSNTATGVSIPVVANRVSYAFNLTGPSMTVDTACSSGMTALHLGCQAIRAGDCTMAICGGVNFILNPGMFVQLCRAGMVCPDGRCKPFSAAANGYARGEGCGVVIIKSFRKALVDKDYIWATIKTGVNQDGRSAIPMTSPSPAQQEQLIRRLYEQHNVDPRHIDYIEAHGTGTPVGDPVEARSLGKAIGQSRDSSEPPVLIGSVKSNFGHLESAAAMAGLIKVLLMMKHKKIAPTLHFNEPNPNIDFEGLKIKVCTEPITWSSRNKDKMMACVNSFGFGGSNAHAILFSEPSSGATEELGRHEEPNIIAVSANGKESLQASMKDLISFLEKNQCTALSQLAYTSSVKRTHHNYRLAFPVMSLEQLNLELQKAQKSVSGLKNSAGPKNIVFVFCGMGTLWEGMCIELMAKEPLFSRKVKEVDAIFKTIAGWSLVDKLRNVRNFDDPAVAQPIIFVCQVALFHLLMTWGIVPDKIVGHSVGEVAAACCAGALSLPTAVRVIYHRGRLQSEVTGGKMLVVGNYDVRKVNDCCQRFTGKVSIAAENSGTSCTVSGDADAVDSLHRLLDRINTEEEEGRLFIRELNVRSAYHSHHMDPICSKLREALHDIKAADPTVQVLSTVTGDLAPKDFASEAYWAKNVRCPVMFNSAMKRAIDTKARNIVVEIGPRPALRANIKEIVGEAELTLVASSRPKQEHACILQCLCDLYQAGLDPQWKAFFDEDEVYAPLPVPRCHLNRQSLWFDPEAGISLRQENDSKASLVQSHLKRLSNSPPSFRCSISNATHPYVYDHRLQDMVVVPGAQYVDLGLAACMEVMNPRQPPSHCRLQIEFLSPATIGRHGDKTDLVVNVHHDETSQNVTFEERTDRAVHARGHVEYDSQSQDVLHNVNLVAIQERCSYRLPEEILYDEFKKVGFHYGPSLCQLKDCRYSESSMHPEALSIVHVPEIVSHDMHNCCIHPALLDYVLQSTILLMIDDADHKETLLPASVGSVVSVKPPELRMWVYLRQLYKTKDALCCNGALIGSDGQVIVEARNIVCKILTDKKSVPFSDVTYTMDWFPFESCCEAPEASMSQLKCLVLADDCGILDKMGHLVSPDSVLIYQSEFTRQDFRVNSSVLPSIIQQKDESIEFDQIVHGWGITLLEDSTTNGAALASAVEVSCESLRQLLKMLIAMDKSIPVKVVTRNAQLPMWDGLTEAQQVNVIDLVGPPLWGLVRAVLRERAYLNCQLAELATGTDDEILTLVQEMTTPEMSEFTEIMLVGNKKYYIEMVRSNVEKVSSVHRVNVAEGGRRIKLQMLETSQPQSVRVTYDDDTPLLDVGYQVPHAQINVSAIRLHEDYFAPVIKPTESRVAVPWLEDSNCAQDLHALDFYGTVVDVTEKCKIKVGDVVFGCFPVVASSTVCVPVSVLKKASTFHQLENLPCLSLLVLAWEVLACVKPKQRVGYVGGTVCPTFGCALDVIATKLKVSVTKRQTACPDEQYPLVIVWEVEACKSARQLQAMVESNGQLIIVSGKAVHQISSLHAPTIYRPDIQLKMVNTCLLFRESNLLRVMPSVLKLLTSAAKKLTRNDLTARFIPLSEISQLGMPGDLNSENLNRHPEDHLTVVQFQSKTGVSVCVGRKQLFRKDCAYLVVGGLTGLGMVTVNFLAEKGAGYIAIMSRSPPNEETNDKISELASTKDTNVVCLQADVTCLDQVEAAIQKLESTFPDVPLKGIFHSAVVTSDGILINQDHSHFQRGMDAKVIGTWNLHVATQRFRLDYFVAYSSIAAIIPNGGQTGYASANAFLDGFMFYRRQQGLSGQTINWGALKLGILERNEAIAKKLEQQGVPAMERHDIVKYLEDCLMLNETQLIVALVNWSRIKRVQAGMTDSRRFHTIFESINGNEPQENTEGFRIDMPSLLNQSSEEQLSTLETFVKHMFVLLLNADEETANVSSSIVDLGIDSHTALSAQQLIKEHICVDVPIIMFLSQETTLGSLAVAIQENLVQNHSTKVCVENTSEAEHSNEGLGKNPRLTYEQNESEPESEEPLSQEDDEMEVSSGMSQLSLAMTDVFYQHVNNTIHDHGISACVHKLFEKQVMDTPQRVALIFKDTNVTYQELNRSATSIARELLRLPQRKQQRHDYVGVYLENTPDLLATLLAIWKAGKIVVPLNMAQPKGNMTHLIEMCNIQVIVTDFSAHTLIFTKLPRYTGHVITVPVEHKLEDDDDTVLQRVLLPDAPAFCMHEADNGRRIVQGLHSGMLNRLTWMWHTFPFKEDDVCCLKTPLRHLDAFWEILVPLLKGVPVVIVTEHMLKTPTEFLQVLREQKVTRLSGVSRGFWERLVAVVEREPPEAQVCVRQLFMNAGNIDFSIVHQASEALHAEEVTVMLSCTAVYSGVVYCSLKPNCVEADLSFVPGYNTEVYVLNEERQLCEVNQPGELCLAAPGLPYHDATVKSNRFTSAATEKVVATGIMAVLTEHAEIRLLHSATLRESQPQQTRLANGVKSHHIQEMMKGKIFKKRTTKAKAHERYVRLVLQQNDILEATLKWGPSENQISSKLNVRNITNIYAERSTLVISTCQRTFLFQTEEVEVLRMWTEGLQYLRNLV
ncbi:phthioceranic/hydroxyphthioceranic acid synthase-like [Branchiostoma floridae x Branchiostoma japonicum]